MLERVLGQLLTLPMVRLAQPGEFTFRAYCNGKLDLTQAEGVAATIAAVSDGQLAAAGHLARGELATFAREQVDALGHLLALTEAGIDFVDQEDVVPIAPVDLAAGVDAAATHLAQLKARSRAWGAVEALPRVVLAGAPSTGKSTLFNALLGRTRAVTDAAAGTTRDVLEEPLQLPDAGEVMLVDLAGLDVASAANDLDHAAQQAARNALQKADLVLAFDDRVPLTAAPQLRIHAKADLSENAVTASTATHTVSAHTGQGLGRLRQTIATHLADRAVSVSAELLALQPRHQAALATASVALANARTHINPAAHALDEIELVAAGLRDALDALAGLGGELTPDDVIGKVFSTFCVGK